MQASENCYNLIKRLEGLELKVYQKVINGKADTPTVGYGHADWHLKVGDVYTQAQCETFLRYDVNRVTDELNAIIKIKNKLTLNQNQFDALCSLVYNIGITEFKGSKTLKMINIFPDDPNITVGIKSFCNVNGKVCEGLLARRTAEAELYFKKVA